MNKGDEVLITVTEENKEEVLKQYVYDIYMSTRYAIPKYKPSIETIGRYSHQHLVSQYALTLEYILRVRRECNILLRILNNQPFKPYDLEKFNENFERLAEKCRERERQEYLEKEARRKRFLQYRRELLQVEKKTSN